MCFSLFLIVFFFFFFLNVYTRIEHKQSLSLAREAPPPNGESLFARGGYNSSERREKEREREGERKRLLFVPQKKSSVLLSATIRVKSN
jgi:hypothetical protein